MGVLADLRDLIKGRRTRPAILMYHRVAEPAFDPWSLAVSPAHFEDQVRALTKDRTVLSLEAFQEGAARGDLPVDAVAITFDDGYVDNFTAALPILKRCGAPATFFLSTGLLGKPAEFWWDELARLVLGHEAAIEAKVTIGGEAVPIALAAADDAERAAVRAWRASEGAPDSPRCVLYHDLWSRLQGLDDEARAIVMADLRGHFGAGKPDPGDLPMSPAQARAMGAEPLVTIGAHSVNHPRLPDLTPDRLAAEIAQSRAACEALTGAPVRAFAYPYGANDAASRAAVREAGLALACTTQYGVTPRTGADPYALPRIAADDEDGAAVLRRLRAA